MNLVFQLSNPLNFNPLYPFPIPPELFKLNGKSLFDVQTNTFREFLPHLSPVVIDSGKELCFDRLNGELDFLHLPSVRLTTLLFLWAAIAMAEGLDSVSLIYPTHLVLHSYEMFFSQVRALQKEEIPSASVLFWNATQDSKTFYLHAEEKVAEIENTGLYRIHTVMREHDESEETINFVGPVFYHHQALLNGIASFDADLIDLFYLLVENWKKPELFVNYFPEIVKEVDMRFSVEFLNNFEDLFTLNINSDFEKVGGYASLMRLFPKDDFGNRIEGNFKLQESYDNFLVNQSNKEIEISRFSEICCFASEEKVSIYPLTD